MYGFGLAAGTGAARPDQLAVPFADGMLVTLPDGIDPAAAASVADNVVTPTVTSDRIYPCCWTATPTCTC